MTNINKETLFAALGFLTVALSGEKQNSPEKAKTMADLIEAFCDQQNNTEPQQPSQRLIWLLDEIIGSIKTQLRAGQTAELPSAEDLKIEILKRLHYRQSIYVMDALKGHELLDAAILKLLEAESKNVKCEAKMKITAVQGDPNAFAPYEHLTTTIVNIIKSKGSCTKEDVKGKGFSNEELDQWSMAYALAMVELNWMDA